MFTIPYNSPWIKIGSIVFASLTLVHLAYTRSSPPSPEDKMKVVSILSLHQVKENLDNKEKEKE
jgi:hypothetical protein